MRPVSLHSGAWRYPGAYPDANFNLAHLKSFIQKLEAAKFDAFFMADHVRSPLSVPRLLRSRNFLDRRLLIPKPPAGRFEYAR